MYIDSIHKTIPDEMSVIRDNIDRHPSLKEALMSNGTQIVYDANNQIRYTLHISDTSVEGCQTPDAAIPEDGDALILEDGFCRHGDALERTKDLQVPDNLYDDNFRESKRSKLCGCAQCGSIFSGDMVKDMISSHGGRDGMAICPICNSNTVVAEESGVEITDDNLWRWNQHTFGEYPMYKNLPEDMSKLTLADIMRRIH